MNQSDKFTESILDSDIRDTLTHTRAAEAKSTSDWDPSEWLNR